MAYTVGKIFGYLLIAAFCTAVFIFGVVAIFRVGIIFAPWIVGALVIYWLGKSATAAMSNPSSSWYIPDEEKDKNPKE